MRIAVDARPLTMPMTGIGRYTHSLLKIMTKSRHEWLLYSDSPLKNEFSRLDNVRIRNGNVAPASAVGLAYSQGVYRSWLKRDKPDLFWSPRHHLPIGLGNALRQVVTIHDVVWKRYPQTMQWQTHWAEKALMAPSVKQADKILCVSEFTKSEVQAFWPEQSDKCVVVRSGGNLNVEQKQFDENSTHKRPYALFVGTLEPRKNLRRLVEAFANLVNENRVQSDLIIVGAVGWGENDLGSLVKVAGAEDRILLLGHISDNHLQQLYSGAHCLAMPSLYEGFGLPVLEAMRYGVPSVISQDGSLAEIAGDSGLLVNPLSADSIANALEAMFNNEAKRSALSKKASKRASEFSWEKAASETLAVFESLIDSID